MDAICGNPVPAVSAQSGIFVFMRKLRTVILLFLFSLGALHAQFQQYRNYNVSDGLPSSEVYSMLQDAAGYLWFTTDMGVSRFDGYQFKNFNTNNGLADNTIFGIHQDTKDRIWFTSFSGRLSYYSKEQFYSLPCNKQLSELLVNTFITSIYVDEHDTIWAGTKMNFLIRIAPGWTDAQVSKIMMKDHEGYMCRFGDKGMIYGGGDHPGEFFTVYERALKPLLTFRVFEADSVPRGARYSMNRISRDNYVLTVNGSILCFNLTGVYSRVSLGAIGICTLVEEDGGIRAGNYNGLIAWNDSLLVNPQPISFFNQKIVTAVYRDSENGLWICTEGNGIYCVAFSHFLYYTPQDGLPQSKISCTAIAGDNVLTGHLDGTMCVLNGTSMRNISFANALVNATGRLVSIIHVNADTILATTNTNVFFANVHSQAVKRITTLGSRRLLRSADGLIWNLSYNRLMKLDAHGIQVGTDVHLDFFADNLFEDRSGKLWICAINGLWSYEEKPGLTYMGVNDSLLASRIVEIGQSPDGALWMVSRGNGVIVMKEGKTFHITEKEGLAGNMCRSIFVDSANVVWVGTNQGLSRIAYEDGDRLNYTTETFTSRNGLLSNEVNGIFRHHGKLWTVHTNGISIFDPAALRSGSSPPVYITSTLVNGEKIDTTVHHFTHDQNYFTFNFIGLSYKDPGHVTYRYKMEGVDTAWIQTTYTSVDFQTLPPGDYRFVVEARNADGNWSRLPASFAFNISPAWWQTWMFNTGALTLAGLVVIMIFKSRVNVLRERERRKALLQSKIATFELNALRAQMNPHFVFNAINSVQYFITNNDPDSSQRYLSKFARLIRYVVDNSKLSSISLDKEIEALHLYLELEALRFGSRLTYTIQVDEGVDVTYTHIPSMLIQPYVENAIWHGVMHKKGDGKIEIRLVMKGDILECTIEDNGIGRSKSREFKKEKQEEGYKSVGMTNTRERLDIINHVMGKQLSVDITDLYTPEGEPCGTRVKIQIPVV